MRHQDTDTHAPRVTVLGEATATNGARRRVLRTDDGRTWIVSTARHEAAPEGETLVMLVQPDGQVHGDPVVEMDGIDPDQAQARFVRAYESATLREPAQESGHPWEVPGTATEAACEALRSRLRRPGGHLRAVR
ncbi:hypothetical protein ACOQFV_24535 [Nocardiopsis changdeensis]|uniref:Uncharacterized protein n=1 Tax=Nocardiopsis changdeensis TaxID=2831969 RepID=A0A975QAN0_9ACTN|nr:MULTISPECIES: hypothetical protein [Nocardiopsis]QUX26441.1 hypothetical protein KGD84_32605 [Nocardiopsis changdeensis]QYX40713.1 hypothetical protein K1J57_32455 [Nocardiopsis sp. MT53]